MPVTTDREYRRIDVTNLETREADDGEMIVEGYATTFNQPYLLWEDDGYSVYEQIDARAFDKADMKDVIMQYDHEGRVFARNKNGTLEITPDDHGLHIRARLGGTQIGRQLYEEIKGGYTDKMSFGFTVRKDERKETRDEENNTTRIDRTITEIKKLFDVSAVSIPANGTTEIYSTRSYCEGVIAEAKAERLACQERARKIKAIKLLMEVSHEDD